MGERQDQPHSLHGLHRRGAAQEGAAALLLRGHWCYVGLEAEIPNPGDFKRTAIGERSVVMSRDEDGAIHVFENVCAHRGMQFCRERHGNKKEFVCPYHQWNYTLKGDLQGVPFRRGVKQDGKVHGGMPADFKTEDTA
jgi:salicylate 5-hydroxylase large subunit